MYESRCCQGGKKRGAVPRSISFTARGTFFIGTALKGGAEGSYHAHGEGFGV